MNTPNRQVILETALKTQVEEHMRSKEEILADLRNQLSVLKGANTSVHLSPFVGSILHYLALGRNSH
jgi:hypothetical protein